MEEIVNKVAKSGLITLDLSTWLADESFIEIDLAPLLWQGLVLREDEFRDWIKNHDWASYQNKHVAVFCSTDAIVPLWAYMLVSSALVGIAKTCINTSSAELRNMVFVEKISAFNLESIRDCRIVIKGCNEGKVPDFAYGLLVSKIQAVVKSLMFGEPCSTVPVYKKKK